MKSLKYYFHATTGCFVNSVFKNIFLIHLFFSISRAYPGLSHHPCFSPPSILIPSNSRPHFNQNELFKKKKKQCQQCYPVVSDILLILELSKVLHTASRHSITCLLCLIPSFITLLQPLWSTDSLSSCLLRPPQQSEEHYSPLLLLIILTLVHLSRSQFKYHFPSGKHFLTTS